MEPEFVAIGEIAKPYGTRGEVKVNPLTDWPQRFSDLKGVYLNCKFFQLDNSRTRIKEKFVYIKLEGIDSRSQAEEIRGAVIEIPRSLAVKLPRNSYYIFQIIGLSVYLEEEEYLGKVIEVIKTGSNDVYEVEGEKGTFLIPAIKDVIKEINIDNKKIIIKPIPGLLDPVNKKPCFVNHDLIG